MTDLDEAKLSAAVMTAKILLSGIVEDVAWSIEEMVGCGPWTLNRCDGCGCSDIRYALNGELLHLPYLQVRD